MITSIEVQIAGILIIDALAIAALWLTAWRFGVSGRVSWGRWFTRALVVADGLLIAQGAVIGFTTDLEVRLFLALGWVGLGASVLILAPTIGQFRLELRRREFRPRDRLTLLRARSPAGDESVRDLKSKVFRALRSGAIRIGKLSRIEKHLVDVFGLSKVKAAAVHPGSNAARTAACKASSRGNGRRDGRRPPDRHRRPRPGSRSRADNGPEE